jgi:predicted ATP-dependent endonuclease of OLD family
MKQLLGIQDQRYEDPWVYVTESEGGEVEIMYTGEALRKVFSALVLFYSLVLEAKAEGSCVYLIEAPEAHLDPTLQRSFATLLLDLARQHKVQLFITTTSAHIFSSVPVRSLPAWVLSNDDTNADALLKAQDVIVLQRNKTQICGSRATDEQLPFDHKLMITYITTLN